MISQLKSVHNQTSIWIAYNNYGTWVKGTEHYYVPQVSVQKHFLKKYAGNRAAEDFVRIQRHEADLYNKYKEFYGYVFFIGKKMEDG